VIEGLRQLVRLQDLDAELHRAEQESAGLPARRAALVEKLAAAELRESQAGEALTLAEASQRRAETERQDREALHKKLEGQQFQVKSNEAYTALLHEMEAARRAISDCETRILEAMVAIDAAHSERAAAREQLAQVRAQGEKDVAVLDAREQELGARIGELREQRGALAAGVDASLREQYERIASRHRPALASVRGGICQGCRVDVPAQLQIELLRGEKLQRCLSCHRILIPAKVLEQAAK
jgi:predicted  nucleic acid-binding Zn-ribbon protein